MVPNGGHRTCNRWGKGGNMRKYIALAGLVAALAIPAVAWAADLHSPHTGGVYGCPAGYVGSYHFVNNQTAGTAWTGHIEATFSGPASTKGADAYMVLQNVQHFQIAAEGWLEDASTDLPGRLVLSDMSCKKK